MATQTTNLGLIKPAGTDYVLVSDFNTNADALDGAIGNLTALQTTTKTDLVAAVNSALTDAEATVAVGTTTTGAAGTPASVTNSGTNKDAVFNFTIPQGIQGAPGGTWTNAAAIPLVDAGGYYATDNVEAALQEVSNYPRLWRKTASLSVAQITPVPSSPLDVTVKTVATQAGSGDPSPSNIRAITGRSSVKVKRTGKNLLNLAFTNDTKNGVTLTYDPVANTVTLNGTCTANNTIFRLLYPLRIPAAHVVSLRYRGGSIAATGLNIFQIAEAGWTQGSAINLTTTAVSTTVVNVPRTYAADGQGIRIDAGTVLTNFVIQVQIEIGSVATAYEPYSGTELTLTPASTLYGVPGAEDEIGVDGHETHNTKLLALTGGVATATDLGTVLRCAIAISPSSVVATTTSAVCSHFKVLVQYANDSEHFYADAGYVWLFVAKSRLSSSDAAGVNTWLAAQNSAGTPVQVLYQLATPTTAQGTAQTLAALAQSDKYTPRLNNVYSDGGNVVVGYAKSPIQETIDAPLPAGTGNSWYTGRDLKALYGDAATFMAALRKGTPFDIRIGDYWPVTLNGTIRDVGSYTAPIGITYYSDTALTSSVGTTATAYEAAYVNATYCSIVVSGTTRYVSTAACLAYFARTLSNAVVLFEVAGINIYYNHGDTALTSPHVLFCPRDCLPIASKMRKADSVWHSEATTNPWLGSAMYATLNDATYGLLPLIAATDIGAYIFGGPNGAGMRTLLPDMAAGTSTPNNWTWRDRGKLFLPTEREVWGSAIRQTDALSSALAVQWPIFNGTLRHIAKGLGNSGSRVNWWGASAINSTVVTRVDTSGYPNGGNASNAYGVPPCFLVA